MAKKDLKIQPVDQEMTKEDLKKVKGGYCNGHYCDEEDGGDPIPS